jgi:hypothetical protein
MPAESARLFDPVLYALFRWPRDGERDRLTLAVFVICPHISYAVKATRESAPGDAAVPPSL